MCSGDRSQQPARDPGGAGGPGHADPREPPSISTNRNCGLPPGLPRPSTRRSAARSSSSRVPIPTRRRCSSPGVRPGAAASERCTWPFHGYTDVTRAISFAATTAGNGPSIPDVHAIPAPYAYRSPVGGPTATSGGRRCSPSPLTCSTASARTILAAVIAEPLISAGGGDRDAARLPQGAQRRGSRHAARCSFWTRRRPGSASSAPSTPTSSTTWCGHHDAVKALRRGASPSVPW